jgi:hypothetical protein
MSQEKNDNLMHVRFYSSPIENPAETRKHGRPVFEDQEFVEIRYAANKQTVHTAPAHEGFMWTREAFGDRKRVTYAETYNEQYRKFKLGQDQSASGTPLSELPFLTEAQRSELRALNVKSAETLAALDGPNLKLLGMKGRELKNAAQAYIDKAMGSADVTALAAENASLKEQMLETQKQISELQKAITRKEPEETETADEGPWEGMSADDIKNWLKDAVGERPKGNPSRGTLIRQANEVLDKSKKEMVA